MVDGGWRHMQGAPRDGTRILVTTRASEQGPAESIEDLVARREMSRAVAEAMRHLPDEQRTAIILKEYHGLTFQEIADLQACPLSTVKTRLYQGLNVLRRHLNHSGTRPARASGKAS